MKRFAARFMFVLLIIPLLGVGLPWGSSAFAAGAPLCTNVFLRDGKIGEPVPVQSPNERIFQIAGRSLKLEENQLKAILSGEQTLYTYSAFGTSYGQEILPKLEGYLKAGARLSSRGYALQQTVLQLSNGKLTDRQASDLVVRYFKGQALDAIDDTVRRVVAETQNEKIGEVFRKELETTVKILDTYKTLRTRIFHDFSQTGSYFRKMRLDPQYRLARRELQQKVSRSDLNNYVNNRIARNHAIWNQTLRPETQVPPEIQAPWLANLSNEARTLIEERVRWLSAWRYYSNYGGLFNDRDRTFVWYASAVPDVSRESFASIQKFFAQNGVTFELRPEANRNLVMTETRPRRFQDENFHIDRADVSSDLITLNGNKLPDDLSRVYVSSPELLQPVQALFEKWFGADKIASLHITFHVNVEQKKIYEDDMRSLVSQLRATHPEQMPPVRLVQGAGRRYFLTEAELNDIRSNRKPLHQYLELRGGSADSLFEALIRDHAHLDRTRTANIPTNMKTIPSQDADVQYLIEFRPEADPAIIQEMLAGRMHFDFRLVSRIYSKEEDSRQKAQDLLDAGLGEAALNRFAIDFDLIQNQPAVIAAEKANLQAVAPGNPLSSLEQAELHNWTPSFEPPHISIDLNNMGALKEALASSANFGLDAGVDIRSRMTGIEYQEWLNLQDLVIHHARARTPLTMEIVDQFFAISNRTSNPSQRVNPGFRTDPVFHQSWPAGKNLGDLWIFDDSDAQHYMAQPYLEFGPSLLRLSPTTVATEYLRYPHTSRDVRKLIAEAVDRYNRSSVHPYVRALMLQRDLILIHPLTDGNGRGSRAILDYLLLASGYVPPTLERFNMLDMLSTPEGYLALALQGSLRMNATLQGEPEEVGENWLSHTNPARWVRSR